MARPNLDRYAALGARIARSILEVSSDGGPRATRIALKVGTWPDNETDLGGLCESALASHIRGVLIDADVFGEFKDIKSRR